MNPYFQKLNESTARIFKLVAFGLLVMVGTAFLCSKHAYSATVGDLPVTCFTADEFAADYQSKTFDIVGKSKVFIFVEGTAYKVDKITTESKDGITGTWLLESTGKFCLVYMENSGKKVVH